MITIQQLSFQKNPVMQGCRKHIDVHFHFHFLRELTKAGTVTLVHCIIDDQVADVMTKSLKLDASLKLRA